MEALLQFGEQVGCYKVLLDCTEKNVPFYESCGMQKKELQMVKYLNSNKQQSKLWKKRWFSSAERLY